MTPERKRELVGLIAKDFRAWGLAAARRIYRGVRRWGVVFDHFNTFKKCCPIEYAAGGTPKVLARRSSVIERQYLNAADGGSLKIIPGRLYRHCEGWRDEYLDLRPADILRACRIAFPSIGRRKRKAVKR